MEKDNSTLDTDEEPEQQVIQTDPTGRFERYAICLGKGAYKEVFKAFDQEEGVEVAWNQLKVDRIQKRDIPRVLSEIRILESLRNENIINFYYSWTAISEDGKENVYFITELMTSGTLKAYIRKTKGSIKPKILKNWCRQILSGLKYLHSRSPPIIHRDVKCENIFINGNNGQAKIGDLGLAVVKMADHVSSVLGTPEFLAPEVYDEKYDEKVDIYAFGMVVLEIFTKEYPYNECTNQAQIYKKVSSGIKPLSLQKVTDEETKEFIETCIKFNPVERPSAEDLLNHPFLASMDFSTLSSSVFPRADSPSIINLESPTALTSSPILNILESSNPLISLEKRANVKTETPELDNIQKSNVFEATSESPRINSGSTCIVDVVEMSHDDEVILRMVYENAGNSAAEIKFPFKLSEDIATDVIQEMVKESLINQEDEQLARRKLEEAIRTVLIGQIRSSSTEPKILQSSTPMTSPHLFPVLDVDEGLANFGMKTEISAPLSPSIIETAHITDFILPLTVNQEPIVHGQSIESIVSTTSSFSSKSGSHRSLNENNTAVQLKLKELQELNLKGLNNMGINSRANFTNKPTNRVNSEAPWSLSWNDRQVPATLGRTATTPINTTNPFITSAPSSVTMPRQNPQTQNNQNINPYNPTPFDSITRDRSSSLISNVGNSSEVEDVLGKTKN